MVFMELKNLTAAQIHRMYLHKEASAAEIVSAYIGRIEDIDPRTGAYLEKNYRQAMKQAEKVDSLINEGKEIPPLAGVPCGIKDNICTDGIKTTCASKILENFVPPYDATVIERLNKNEAVVLGKTNMDEFAMGSSSENSAYKKVRNPWDLDRVPGGSSGGSAAAVAAGEAVFALGSDTGGSVRQPASLCGVVGMKPTYGLLSRYGLVAFASSLDQIGIFTRDVEDMALVLNATAGWDERDSTSYKMEIPDYSASLTGDIRGMRIGLPSQLFGDGIDSGVRDCVMRAVDTFKSLGATVEEILLPHADYALSAYYILSSAEASSNLARYDGIRYGHRSEEYTDAIDIYTKSRTEGFGAEVKRRIMLGTYALSAGYYDAYYKKALKVRTLIKNDFEEAFKGCDVMLGPTSPTVAFKLGERIKDPLRMYMSDICTVPVNIAGVCALSLPCGMSDNLPVGLQLIGNYFAEEKLLRAGYAYQRNTGWHKLSPAI